MNHIKKLTYVAIILLAIFSCDLYNKSIPEFLDKYTNSATVAEHSFTEGILLSPQGSVYSNLIQKDSTIDFKLRNPKNFNLYTYLDYSITGDVWEEFARTEAPDYKTVEFTAPTSSGISGTIVLKHELTDQLRMIISNGGIGESYRLRLRLKEYETLRDFEPYIIPKLTCTDYPVAIDLSMTVRSMAVRAGADNYGMIVSWQEVFRGDPADANKLVIISQLLDTPHSYKRISTGSAWVSDPVEANYPPITLNGSEYSVPIASGVKLNDGATYSATIHIMNEAGVERITSGSFAVADLDPITISTISGVTAPVGGVAPVTTITETTQFTGTVTWVPPVAVGSTFAPGVAYTASIALAPKAGYTTNGVAANFFTVAGANPVTNPVNSGVITAVFPATANQTITGDEISGVAAPMAGATPVIAITETDQYTGTVTWNPAVVGTFAYATVYTATITLTPKSGYTFTGTPANCFTVPGANPPATNPIDSGVITAAFPITGTKSVNVGTQTGALTFGTAGTATYTVTTANIADGAYSGTFIWYTDSTGNNTAATPTDITPSISNVTGNAATVTINATTAAQAGSYYFSVTIDNVKSNVATLTIAPQTINIAAIPGVTPPVAGATPVTAITPTAQYTGAVTWAPTVASTFDYATVYTANITLAAQPNYTFTGVAANYFTVASGTTVTHPVNSGNVTVVFPTTGNQVINLAAIPGVTPPATGATPVLTITETDQYTGTVTWEPPGTQFTFNTRYEATITLSAKTGYTLTGVAANFFTVSGANSATNTVNSGVVTAAFPETTAPVDIAAIQGVTPPVVGATPVTAITPTTQYTGTVTWEPNDIPFVNGKIYTAIINLTSNEGYVFTDVPSNFFTVAGAEVSYNGGTAVVFATFPSATVPIIELFDFNIIMDLIVNNISESLSVMATLTPSGTLYYQWYSNTTNSNTGGTLLDGETSSSFTIPTNLPASINPYYYYCVISADGAASVTSGVKSFTVNLPVTSVAITVAAPVPGATPATTATITTVPAGTATITSIQWDPDHSTFQENGEYTVDFLLSSASSYAFSPSCTLTINGQEPSYEAMIGNKVRHVSYKFPPVPPEFSTTAELLDWLNSQPDNTPETPYNVAMNISNLSALRSIEWPSNKYVHLDFTESSFTNFNFRDIVSDETPITGVTIGSSVTNIQTSNVYDLPNLATINVASGNPNYSSIDGVLYNKDQTTLLRCPAGKTGTVTIPNTVTTIDWDAFMDCSKLTGTVTIPNSVTEICSSAFVRSGFYIINIPASVDTMGEYPPFEDCPNLTAINVDPGNTYFSSDNGVLYNKDQTTIITFPSGKGGTYNILNTVTTIGRNAFIGNDLITAVTIPNSVTFIDIQNFYRCNSITSITLPSSIANLDTYIFYECANLSSVTFMGTIPSANFPSFNQGPEMIGLRNAFYATDPTNGTPGTYTRTPPATVWTRQ